MRQSLHFCLMTSSIVLITGCSQNISNVDARTRSEALALLGEGQGVTNNRDLNNNGEVDNYDDNARRTDWRIKNIISRLSLSQKVNLVTGTGFTVDGVGGSNKVPGAAGSTFAIEELGIPAMVFADGPAGLRIEPKREGNENSYYATAFPIATVLASTWDKVLVRQVGQAMGQEVKEYGVDLFLAPGMNIHYNPLGGRNFEYYSEDPYLSGTMAAAMVNGVESNDVGATIKHFVGNSAETSRMWSDSKINERALREIYLRGFEIAVKQSQPWAVMTSYNKVNTVYTSQDKKLLIDVLRDEWGFDGIVMTDWFAGDDAAEQMVAGNDLIMPGMPKNREQIKLAVEQGRIDEAILDRNLANILATVLKSPTMRNYQYSDKPDLTGHAAVARQAAAEGIILLKNNSALPLMAKQNIAVFGNTSYDFISGGTGSGDVNEAYTVSLVAGLANGGFTVNKHLKTTYEAFISAEQAKLPEKKNFFDLLPRIAEYSADTNLLARMAQESEVALITLGRNSGEFFDRTIDGDFTLTQAEQDLISHVSTQFHQQGKKVIVVLNIGNVIETQSWRDKVDAIVLPWQGGQESGNAVVDVLTGKINPSGKLPTTFPLQYSDNASANNFPGFATSPETVTDPFIGIFVGKHTQLDYQDGIYVGYRYYDAFNVSPAFEFGYGLSYTRFSYSDISLQEINSSGEYHVSLRVKNTGSVAGKEVVQLYVDAPNGKLPKPEQELKGFLKTSLLQPAESMVVNFTLTANELASFDEHARAWVAEAGHYRVMVGSSSRDIRQEANFSLAEQIVAQTVIASLAPENKVLEISPTQ